MKLAAPPRPARRPRRLAALLALLALPLAAPAASPPPPAGVPALHADWLAAHRQWRVGVVLQAPYAQLDGRKHTLYGAHVELMEQLAAQLGVRLQWQHFPSAEALEAARLAGQIDLAPGLQQTAAGLRHWLFSEPFMRVSYLVVGERSGQVGLDLDRLGRGEPLALAAPPAVADYLSGSYPNLYLQPAASAAEALHRLLAQQARYAVLDEAQLSQLAREVEQEALAIVGDIGLPQLLRVAVRRDWPQLAQLVDAGLRAIPAKQLDQLHRRWLQPPGHALIEQTLGFWRAASLLLGLLALSVLALLVAVRRQLNAQTLRLLEARRQVEQRDCAAEELRLAQFSIDQGTVGILWINWDSRVRYANRAVERLLGYPPGGVVGRPLADFKPDLHMDRWLEVWKRVRAGRGPTRFETDYRRADGSLLPAELSLSFLRYGRAEYLVVFVADISERRRALAALRASEAQLRELSAHLESVREEEKAHIAREVHDELGQVLTGLKLETSMAELSYAALDPGLRERLGNMKRQIAHLFQLVRDVATALRPPILDAGLASAIEWQARRFEARTQIPCLVEVPEQLPALSDAKATGLFRILQEALTNVTRHAQAQSVALQLAVEHDRLCLSISDDGRGFAVDATRPRSFGLVGMHERALMLDGSLHIASRPGEGTTLTVRVPLDPAPPALNKEENR